MTGLAKFRQRRYRPLLVKDGTLYASKGFEIFSSTDGGESFYSKGRVRVPWYRRVFSRIRPLERLLREGIHSVEFAPDGGMVVIIRKGIAFGEPGSSVLNPVLKIQRGSRPLNLCRHPSGSLYFGEYFSNGKFFQNKPARASSAAPIKRQPVHIFESQNGRDWRVVNTFPKNTVRHIHKICYDDTRNCMLVLTGDLGDEAAIWVTYDAFRTLDPLVQGTQRARAVSVLPTPRGLLVPMDSPLEANFINHFDFDSREFRPVFELDGSAYSALRVGDLLLVTTMVDYSSVNTGRSVYLHGSVDGESWHVLDRFEMGKDPLAHPAILLTPMEGDSKFVFSYFVNIAGYDDTLVRWSIKDIKELIGGMK